MSKQERMSVAQYMQEISKKPKQNKYHNKKTEVEGILFDSKKEADRYIELRLSEMAYEIYDLKLQVPFVLIPKQEGERAVTYRADFYYKTRDGKEVAEDTKGFKTKEYIIKRKLFKHLFPHITFKEV